MPPGALSWVLTTDSGRRTGANMATHSYRETLKHRGLQPFLWTQFLGAFNDNLFKIVVSMLAVQMVIRRARRT